MEHKVMFILHHGSWKHGAWTKWPAPNDRSKFIFFYENHWGVGGGGLLELFDEACLKVSVDGKPALDQMSSGNKALSGPKLTQT